ncbi:GntR family transcriptional regulator [Bacillus sp. DJP31]|uniref:GntR family transcriptional regulator n=1 Tax=Bacillus sp. DJP31 TaxID=3409789 RepID=UPI003BB659DD
MLLIYVEKKTKKSLTLQVFEQIKNKILIKEFQVGYRLPSSRELATVLGISRNVILEAYEQLVAEGYLIVKPRSGTFVAPESSFERKEELPESTDQRIQLEKEKDLIDFKVGNPEFCSF